MEADVKNAIAELKLQPEDNFVLKVMQFEELLTVRHSVFIIGAAGTGISILLNIYFNFFFEFIFIKEKLKYGKH
jgi:dynein heavy chain